MNKQPKCPSCGHDPVDENEIFWTLLLGGGAILAVVLGVIFLWPSV